MKKKVFFSATIIVVVLALSSLIMRNGGVVSDVFAEETCLDVESWHFDFYVEVYGTYCWQYDSSDETWYCLGTDNTCEAGNHTCGVYECKWWRSDCISGPVPEPIEG